MTFDSYCKLILYAMGIIILLMLAVLIPGNVSADVSEPIYKTKTYPVLTAFGETSYASMHFAFNTDGSVTVRDDNGNRLRIDAPATLYKLTEEKDLVIQDFGTWQTIYDFSRNDNVVKITYRGTYSGKIEFPLAQASTSADSKEKSMLYTYSVGQLDEEGNSLITGITYDWSDAAGTVSRDSKTNTLSFEATGSFDIDPSVVGSTTHYLATGHDNQRNTFYANGRHWVFYSDGTNYVWRTSTDGESWSDATTVSSGSDGTYWNTFYDGTYIHYARWASNAIYYRRGATNTDGTIDWSAAEQTAVAVDDATGSYGVAVSVDSSGYPWIGWKDTTDGGQVSKSSANDGTWSDVGGFPYVLGSVSGGSLTFVPGTSDKMYVLYYLNGLKGKLWNSSWGSEESIDSTIRGSSSFSATGYSDVVQVAYLDANPYPIVYIERSAGGSWGDPVTIYGDTSSSSVHMTLTSTNDTGDLILFWTKCPTEHHIFYKERISDTWDESATDWIDESVDNLAYGQGYPASFYEAESGLTGVAYVTGTSSPWNVEYAFLTGVSAPTVTNSAADNITTVGADLHGEITSDGGDTVTTIGFEWDTDSGAPYANDWHDDYSTDIFEHTFTDMPSDTTIYWRAYATNGIGTGYSDELNFSTLLPLPGAPTDLTITQTDIDEITLTWTTGDYADATYIRIEIDSYPTSITDGYEVYDGALETITYDGLELSSHTYYITAWSENATGYSTDTAKGNIGGETMLLFLFGGLGLAGLVCAFIFKHQVFSWLGAGFWGLFAFFAYQQSAGATPLEIVDVYMGMFWIGVGALIVTALISMTLHGEKKVDDYADYDEGERELKDMFDGMRREREKHDEIFYGKKSSRYNR